MEELVKMIEEMGIPFAYDHFAEGKVLTRRLSAIFSRTMKISQPMGRCITG